MPRLTDRNPKYRKHRASGQAIVTINGRDHYLGPWQTKTSKANYDRVIAEYLASGRTLIEPAGATISELLASYRIHCEKTYPAPDGGKSVVAESIGYACKPLRILYGNTPAAEFGPLKLKALIGEFIRIGWCRSHINKQVQCVKAFFRWAVSNEFIPPMVYHGLQSVSGLRRGRSEARESEPVKPVAESHAAAVFSFVSRQVKAMIELQLHTGMRPGEVCIMRGCDLDTSGSIWSYTPSRHKTQNHGIARTIYFGPKAQNILKPFLKPDLQAYLFSPAEAEAERRALLTQRRKTPLSCGNKPGSNVQRKPKKKPGDRYCTQSYFRCVYAACFKAYPYPGELLQGNDDDSSTVAEKKFKRIQWRKHNFWSPNQLRHTAATNIRREFGAEAAQTILGHTQLKTTEIYAEKNAGEAMKIMAAIG